MVGLAVFWVSALAVVYIYLGYPVLAWLVAHARALASSRS